MYETILVPTDFSESADAAWKHAVALAKLHGSKVVVYVIEPVLSHYGLVGLVPGVQELEAQHDITSRLKLKEVLDSSEAVGIKVEGKIANGKPWRCIVDMVSDVGAALVVMGSHGRSGLFHEQIGSVAERVVRQSPCPVLVVRPGQVD